MKSDNHSHILFDDVTSMVKAAKSKNLDCISITEHISQFKELRSEIRFGSVHRTGRIFLGFEEYLHEFETLDVPVPTVNIGLEVDFNPRYEENVSGLVNREKWDLLLCSVHELENRIDIENKGHRQDRQSSEKRWVEYLELQKKALASEHLRFDVLAHPVRLGRSTRITPPHIDGLLLDLAQLAKSEGKALEINGNDIARNPSLVEQLAQACSGAGCSVSFGSDAHRSKEVGSGYDKARDLIQHYHLRELEVPQILNRRF